MGLREVEVHVVEDVELPYVEGGTCLDTLAEGLKEKQLQAGRVGSEEDLHGLGGDGVDG
jgi:hypothetical protein